LPCSLCGSGRNSSFSERECERVSGKECVEVFCKLGRLPADDGEENSQSVQNELAVDPEGDEF
jgi:hypothetical protein